jgi:all-trans-8'-apo-beta-carotenal 15,15'-oxygenase
MICAFTFKNGRCHFRNRFVRTEEYMAEQKAGRMLYRGVFGTQKPGGWLANIFDLKMKNIANTNVIYWGGKLLALWEAARPYRLEPHSLETIGLDNFDGILQPGDVFSAHPRIDPHSQFNQGRPSLVNFAVKPGVSTTITIYEFDEKGKLITSYERIVPGFAFIHDFVLTPNYCIFFQNPVSYNPLPYLFGLKGAGECVKFHQNKPTNILVIPRKAPHKDVKVLQAEAGFIFHHANAFEDHNQIIVDSICYQSLAQIDPDSSYKEVDFDKLAPGQLWRFSLNLNEQTVTKKLSESRCCEFPSIHPEKVGRKYRYLFIGATHNETGNAPLQALLKLDLHKGERQLHSFAPKGFAGEPIFVPKPKAQSEDDGWVLMLIYDSTYHRSDLVIFEGVDITNPLAKLHLKHHIPYGLHGSWTEELSIR